MRRVKMETIKSEIEDGKMFFNPYEKPINLTRTGSIFRAHAYPTKINYRSIVPFILAHTEPGDVVYDCFAGICSTGIAAAACTEPDESLLSQLNNEAKSRVKWGKRKAICLDIGVLPTFIGRTLLKPIDIEKFAELFDEVMKEIEEEWKWIYQVEDKNESEGEMRYTFWSEIIQCPNCGRKNRYTDIFVDFDEGNFLSKGICPECSAEIDKRNAEPVTEKVYDRLLEDTRVSVKRVPVKIFGESEGKTWSREVTEKDKSLLEEIEKAPLPEWVEPIPILTGEDEWGELYRSGYHRGISHLHHFYTHRNFLALSVLYDAARQIPKKFRRYFEFIVSSYNGTHSTLMTRFVFKSGKNKPVITSAQPGVLYIPSCPVEKNVFRGVKRKFRQFKKAMKTIRKWKPDVDVYTRPAQDSRLDSNSVDYIFTDPPFGNDIQYSEINFISEAWLGAFTNNSQETIISDFQNKTLSTYEELLKQAFRESYRVLKENHYMTVIFHSRKKEIWNSLRRAITHAGFEIVKSSILDREQTSFKQTTTKGAVQKDPIILAKKTGKNIEFVPKEGKETVEEFIAHRLEKIDEFDSKERTFDYLFSRYVGNCITKKDEVDLSADEFRQVLEEIAVCKEKKWYLKGGA